jgi:Carboxypeptidase regulatory-like domain
MSTRIALQFVILAAAMTLPIGAQQPTNGGTITGIVKDSADRPVAGADVIAHPGDRRTRTDSAGRFVFSGLDPDNYTVRARKLGFAPEDFDVKLSKTSHVDISLVLAVRMPMLDTVTIRADRKCPEFTLEGFVCRRHAGVGTFMDYTDIDDKEAIYTADLFRDIKGFRESVRPTRDRGPMRVVQPNLPWGCVKSLVNGRDVTPANQIPEYPSDLVALEVYARPDSVPEQFQRYTWPGINGDVTRSGRCGVIVYWTQRAKLK